MKESGEMSDAPQIEGLGHLRRVIREEIDRAKREGVGSLYLEGCRRVEDRALVDEQVRALLDAEPGCRLMASHATAEGYLITVGGIGEYVPGALLLDDLPPAD